MQLPLVPTQRLQPLGTMSAAQRLRMPFTEDSSLLEDFCVSSRDPRQSNKQLFNAVTHLHLQVRSILNLAGVQHILADCSVCAFKPPPTVKLTIKRCASDADDAGAPPLNISHFFSLKVRTIIYLVEFTQHLSYITSFCQKTSAWTLISFMHLGKADHLVSTSVAYIVFLLDKCFKWPLPLFLPPFYHIHLAIVQVSYTVFMLLKELEFCNEKLKSIQKVQWAKI